MNVVTIKNTKTELLTAYEQMRDQYEDIKRKAGQSLLLQRQDEDKLLQKTAHYTIDNLDTVLVALRKSILDSFGQLSEKISDESAKLSEIREVIAIEGRRLQEIRNIELGSQALDMVIASYDDKNRELAEKYRLEEEKLLFEIARKKKEWEREQEDYVYNQKISRRKEIDIFEAECFKKETVFAEKMNEREKEISEKEQLIVTKQETFARLEAEAKDFTKKIEEAISVAEKNITDRLQKEFLIEKKMMEQEWKAEKNMLETKIASLVELSKIQATEIKSSKDALATANQQAQTLAVTVIENVSGGKQARFGEIIKE